VAHTLDSAERIVDLVQDTDRICMVGFVHRYWNNCAVLKAYIEDDLFGDIYHFEGRYSRRRGVPGRGTWYTSDNVAGGGALMDLGTHVVDLLLYLLDYPDVSEIASKTRANFGGQTNYAYLNMFGEDGHSDMFDVEDSASAFVEFEDGTTAIVEAAWAANREPAHTYIINGKRAGADLDIAERSLELRETRDMGAVHHIDSTVRTTENDAHKTALEAFFDAIQSRDTSGIPTVEEGLRVQRIIDQIYEQNESP
jgi:predicted dehydrogenase